MTWIGGGQFPYHSTPTLSLMGSLSIYIIQEDGSWPFSLEVTLVPNLPYHTITIQNTTSPWTKCDGELEMGAKSHPTVDGKEAIGHILFYLVFSPHVVGGINQRKGNHWHVAEFKNKYIFWKRNNAEMWCKTCFASAADGLEFYAERGTVKATLIINTKVV